MTIDVSKQQALDADTTPIQQIKLTGNLENQSATSFIIEEAKETVFTFFTRNCNSISNLFCFNIK